MKTPSNPNVGTTGHNTRIRLPLVSYYFSCSQNPLTLRLSLFILDLFNGVPVIQDSIALNDRTITENELEGMRKEEVAI
jgi:hypothetical protein